jgi:hypothetical protein
MGMVSAPLDVELLFQKKQCIAQGIYLNSWLSYRWGNDASTSQQETQEHGTEWWD